MGSAYGIMIESTDEGGAEVFVRAHGSLKLITMAAKEGLAEIKGEPGNFRAVITEDEEVNGDSRRQVCDVTAEADIVALTVNKRLKNERAQHAPTTPATGADSDDTSPALDGGDMSTERADGIA
jgi:hypothetical protein